ncbi:DDE-type integrase/transposase/recombinase [Phenylobacterium sp. LjRoot225]|uniref:Mu transposase C-terminal domain-containing protein n=1 Tax=Phenylobacterium sp. LjRoot225 TaxID=3342285 RepID=UPI003ED0DC2F
MARGQKGRGSDVEPGQSAAERRWQRAVERQRVLRSLIESPTRTRADVEVAARRLNLHPATVYRLIARYAVDGTATAITAGVGGWRKGLSKLPARTGEIIDAAIEEVFLDPQAPTKAQLGRDIAKRCVAAGLKPPSASAISRRVERVELRIAAARRRGANAAERETMRPGSLVVTIPNAVWQIDHSPADVILVDASTRAPIGRPWVTLIIDVASRVVTGLHVSLDAPSAVSVGMAMRHAILPKAEALAERGIAADWPAFGTPELIHSDNGADFRSRSFARACANLGIETDRRPVGAPRYGGHIERLIGSVMQEMHLVPGTTFSNVAERGAYDSDAAAVMTVEEFEAWLWRFVAGDYNRRIHTSLMAPPLETWRRLCNQQGVTPRMPADLDALAFAFLPRVSRTITRQGIVFNHVRYYEPFLEPLFDAGERRQEIAYDPRDLSQLFIETPQGRRALRYRNLAHPPMSLWDLRAARRRLVAEGRGLVDEEALFAARAANEELTSRAKAETRRQRREAVRRQRHRTEAASVAAPSSTAIAPEPVDSTAAATDFHVEIEPW